MIVNMKLEITYVNYTVVEIYYRLFFKNQLQMFVIFWLQNITIMDKDSFNGSGTGVAGTKEFFHNTGHIY